MRTLIALIAVLAVSPCLAQDGNIDQLAERLIALRAEVETLQSELDIQREEHKSKMSYLTAQQSELEANLDREGLRVRQLEDELEELRTKADDAGADAETLAPVVLQAAAKLRAAIQSSLPFKQNERLQALDEVETQLNSGAIVPQRAANRLWALVEDELRISRENAIYSQTIPLKGEPVLVDIAKLGTIAMYFRTRDDRYGFAQPQNGQWQWQLTDDAIQRDQIAQLFDSLRKQIRQGYFEIPGALPAVVDASR
ncbi:MAG: DUF3450 domain-containing protein [Xanthomonadales bacterium]|nr:DUF3450 domain-containing protein [Xanthomonadales bacterium]